MYFFQAANPKRRQVVLIFSIASLYSPVFISDIVSSANDENVVNPPKSPVKRKALALSDRL